MKREEPLLGIGKSRAESGIKKKPTGMQAIKAVKPRCIWSGNWRQGAQEFEVILGSVVSSKQPRLHETPSQKNKRCVAKDLIHRDCSMGFLKIVL